MPSSDPAEFLRPGERPPGDLGAPPGLCGLLGGLGGWLVPRVAAADASSVPSLTVEAEPTDIRPGDLGADRVCAGSAPLRGCGDLDESHFGLGGLGGGDGFGIGPPSSPSSARSISSSNGKKRLGRLNLQPAGTCPTEFWRNRQGSAVPAHNTARLNHHERQERDRAGPGEVHRQGGAREACRRTRGYVPNPALFPSRESLESGPLRPRRLVPSTDANTLPCSPPQ